MIGRVARFVVLGVGAATALGYFTSWTYAAFCCAALLTADAARQAVSASPLDVPMWMSGRGKNVLLIIELVGLLSPLVVGVTLFRWWWPLVGYPLAGLAAQSSQLALGGMLRLYLGILAGLGAIIALL